MAIATVSSQLKAQASGTSMAFSGQTAGSGNVQIVFIAMDSGTGTISAPNGNYVQIDSTSSASIATKTFKASTLLAAPSFSVSPSANCVGGIIELSGADNSTIVDVHSIAATSSFNTASAYTSGAVTPTAANERIIAFFSILLTGDNNNSSGGPAGYTEIGAGAGAPSPSIRAYFLDNPALSSQQPGRTWGVGNEDCAAAYVVVKVAASGTTPATKQYPFMRNRRFGFGYTR